METFLVIGVNAASKGVTQGEVGLVAGGLALIALALLGFFVWRCWGPLLRPGWMPGSFSVIRVKEGGGNDNLRVKI